MIRFIKKIYYFFFSKNKDFARFLVEVLGFLPSNISLYNTVFRHKSHFPGPNENNERLELLGDSIYTSIITEILFKKYPLKSEGFLTEMRSKLVSRRQLNIIGEELNLVKNLSYNQKSTNNLPHDMAGNTFEALVGAIYLAEGYGHAKRFVHKEIIHKLLDIENLESTDFDFKSKLFILSQKENKIT